MIDSLASTITTRHRSGEVAPTIVGVGTFLIVAAMFAAVAASAALVRTGAGMLAAAAGLVGLVLLGAVCGRLADAVAARERAALERSLLERYGVPIRRHQPGIWEIDGELREATLADGQRLMVDGRELAHA